MIPPNVRILCRLYDAAGQKKVSFAGKVQSFRLPEQYFAGKILSAVGKILSAVGKIEPAVGKIVLALEKIVSAVGKIASAVGKIVSAVGTLNNFYQSAI